MLSKATLARRICPGCQFQLRLREPLFLLARPKLQKSAPPSNARFSSSSSSDNQAPPPEPPSPAAPESTVSSRPIEDVTYIPPQSGSAPVPPKFRIEYEDVSPRPLRPGRVPRQYRRSSGHQVTLDAEGLDGMSMLGQPAHAIVMTPSKKKRRRDQAIPSNPTTDDPDRPADMAHFLSDPANAATLDEAAENLERLRPSGTSIVPEAEFRTLQHVLLTGFTAPQLQAYMNAERDREGGAGLKKDLDGPRYPWIQEQWEWISHDAYATDEGSPKEKLVLALMRGCWRLSIQEGTDKVGRMMVKLGHMPFQILLRMCTPHPYSSRPSRVKCGRDTSKQHVLTLPFCRQPAPVDRHQRHTPTRRDD